MGFGNAAPERPYRRTLEWGSTEKSLTEYIKSKVEGEKGETVSREFDCIIILEELYSVSGYNKKRKEQVWSNELLDPAGKLKVRCGNEVIAEGTYKEVKETAKTYGGGYTKVLIALADGELVRILLSGSGRAGWFDKGFSPMSSQCGVRIAGTQAMVNGNVEYNQPIFEKVALTDEQKKNAISKWEEIDPWIKSHVGDNEQSQETNYDEHNQELQEAAEEAKAPYSDEVPF